jgi:hypothetical protein
MFAPCDAAGLLPTDPGCFAVGHGPFCGGEKMFAPLFPEEKTSVELWFATFHGLAAALLFEV